MPTYYQDYQQCQPSLTPYPTARLCRSRVSVKQLRTVMTCHIGHADHTKLVRGAIKACHAQECSALRWKGFIPMSPRPPSVAHGSRMGGALSPVRCYMDRRPDVVGFNKQTKEGGVCCTLSVSGRCNGELRACMLSRSEAWKFPDQEKG